MILKIATTATVLLAFVGTATAQQPTVGQEMTGAAAWAKLVGNTVTGKVGGADYTDYYLADGSVKSLEDSKLSTGKWTLEGLNVCFAPPRRCYVIEVVGDVATFTPRTGEAYRVNILQGNAKNL